MPLKARLFRYSNRTVPLEAPAFSVTTITAPPAGCAGTTAVSTVADFTCTPRAFLPPTAADAPLANRAP
jgi:hypothetical protein